MICKKCGKELSDDMAFCPSCGEKVLSNVIDIVEEEIKEEVERGPWKNFAKFAHVLGIVSLCIFWMFSIGLLCGATGIVLSCLGRKSKKYKSMADLSFKRSLLGTILSLGFYTIIVIISFIINLIG